MENNGMATVEFVNKIQELVEKANNKFETQEINGDLYVNQKLHKVKPETCGKEDLSSLCALVDFTRSTVEKNKEQFAMPLQIMASYDTIYLKSSLDNNMDRNNIAEACPILPRIYFDHWMSMEQFIIQLQTCFVDTPNKQALIEIISKMTDITSVKRTDDGLGQQMTVSKGTGLKEEIKINPIVRLTAYRTFQEVEQVETMYLIRIQEGGELRIIEADGGAWKLEAQRRVSTYLRMELVDLIESGDVVIVG